MEIFGSNSAGDATKKLALAPVKLLGEAPVQAALDVVMFKNPIAGIQNNVRGALGDLALWPFRFTGHVLAGGAKTALKLGWSALINSPLIPVGNTNKAFLRNPAQAIRSFDNALSAGKSPAEAFGSIAPKPKDTPKTDADTVSPPPADTEG